MRVPQSDTHIAVVESKGLLQFYSITFLSKTTNLRVYDICIILYSLLYDTARLSSLSASFLFPGFF